MFIVTFPILVLQGCTFVRYCEPCSWAVQAGLLTPLAFARYHLSLLAAFTLVCTFFTMEGGDSEFANFTLPILKALLEAHSHNVSGNKR